MDSGGLCDGYMQCSRRETAIEGQYSFSDISGSSLPRGSHNSVDTCCIFSALHYKTHSNSPLASRVLGEPPLPSRVDVVRRGSHKSLHPRSRVSVRTRLDPQRSTVTCVYRRALCSLISDSSRLRSRDSTR